MHRPNTGSSDTKSKKPWNRTLENYPMDYQLSTTTRSMAIRRQVRQEEIQLATKKTQTCSTQANYSKRMFEDALLSLQKDNPPAGEQTRDRVLPKLPIRIKSSPTHRVPSYAVFTKVPASTGHGAQRNVEHSPVYSGPTAFGSPVYNSRAKLMNSVRMRPKSEPPCIYNHERWSSTPDILRTLRRSNSAYRLVPSGAMSMMSAGHRSTAYSSTTSCHTLPSFHELVFVPLEEFDDFERQRHHRQVRCGDFAKEKEVYTENNSSSNEDEEEGQSDDNVPLSSYLISAAQEENVSQSSQEPISSGARDKMHNGALTSSVVRADSNEGHADLDQGGENNNSQVRAVRELSNSQRIQGDDECQSRASSSSSRARSAARQQFTHWVDTVTVSSVKSRTSAGSAEEQIPGLGLPRPGEGSTTSKKKHPVTSKAKILPAPPVDSRKTPVDGVEEEKRLEDESEGLVVKEHVVLLPNFVCPSSEEKSREARTRDWMKSTCFTFASRNVPAE